MQRSIFAAFAVTSVLSACTTLEAVRNDAMRIEYFSPSIIEDDTGQFSRTFIFSENSPFRLRANFIPNSFPETAVTAQKTLWFRPLNLPKEEIFHFGADGSTVIGVKDFPFDAQSLVVRGEGDGPGGFGCERREDPEQLVSTSGWYEVCDQRLSLSEGYYAFQWKWKTEAGVEFVSPPQPRVLEVVLDADGYNPAGE